MSAMHAAGPTLLLRLRRPRRKRRAPRRTGQGDTEALSNRIAALEQSTRSNEREAAIDDKVSRRAVVASALRDAVERGNPFVAELAAAKLFATDAGALAPLEDFASTGVPSTMALARDLSALAQPMMKAIGDPVRTGSVMEKLQASAEKLVRIRPVGEAPGDDPATVVARIEAKAARNDIVGARDGSGEIARLRPRTGGRHGSSAPRRAMRRSRRAGNSRRTRSAHSENPRYEDRAIMIRVIVFLVAVALAALGVAWFADRPGEVAVVWGGWRVETSLMVGAVALLVLVAALIFVWSVLRGMIVAPRRLQELLAAPARRAGISRDFPRSDRDRGGRCARRAEIHRRGAASCAVRAADASSRRADRATGGRSRRSGKNIPRHGRTRRHQASRLARFVRGSATARRRQCRETLRRRSRAIRAVVALGGPGRVATAQRRRRLGGRARNARAQQEDSGRGQGRLPAQARRASDCTRAVARA